MVATGRSGRGKGDKIGGGGSKDKKKAAKPVSRPQEKMLKRKMTWNLKDGISLEKSGLGITREKRVVASKSSAKPEDTFQCSNCSILRWRRHSTGK